MKYRKLIGALVGGITVIAPILSFFADEINKDKEMDEIANRVVEKMRQNEVLDDPKKEQKRS